MNRDHDKGVLPTGLAEATGIFRLAAQILLLPTRVFLLGLEAVTESLRAVGQFTGQDIDTVAGRFEPSVPRSQPSRASGNLWANTTSPPLHKGAVLRGAGKLPKEEENEMSGYNCGCGKSPCCCDEQGPCSPVNCDRDLSGDCCIKIVQYLIVSAVQGIRDSERIIAGPETIAFSDDLTEDGLVAWVVAKHADELKDVDKKFLRVPYCVFGRTPVAGIDLKEAQVAILADIARKLPPPEGGGKLAKS